MEESQQGELEELLTRRLIKQSDDAEAGRQIRAAENSEAEPSRGEEPKQELIAPPSTETSATVEEQAGIHEQELIPTPSAAPLAPFTKVEKSLAALGFFTPSSRRLKEHKVKKLTFSRELDGKRVEATAQIVPSVLFGLPVTADQDKYLALQKIITSSLQTDGKISNPIRFRTADLLRLLNRDTDAGKNYKEVREWLSVMTATTIISEGAVWHAGRKNTVTDRLHVFDRAVTVGEELDDGTIADANFVWLSPWQLANINSNFLLPIDLDTYRQLKSHIAKALVPLLQIWLFASQKSGVFEKRYDELCEILNVQTYRAQSQILRQLKPSLDELVKFEYLETWSIEKTIDKKAYKILFFHGAKFHRDRRRRLEQKATAEATVVVAQYEPPDDVLPAHGKLEITPDTTVDNSKAPKIRRGKRGTAVEQVKDPIVAIELPLTAPARDIDPSMIAELTMRGVLQSNATELLRSLPESRLENVLDYIDYWDNIRPDKERGKGPGLLVHLIQNGDPLPQGFETRRKRAERQAAEERREKLLMLKQILTSNYEQHCRTVLDRYITEQLGADEFERRVTVHIASLSKQSDFWADRMSPELLDQVARHSVRTEIGKTVTVMPYEDYRNRELPRLLAELNINPADLGLDSTGQWQDKAQSAG